MARGHQVTTTTIVSNCNHQPLGPTAGATATLTGSYSKQFLLSICSIKEADYRPLEAQWAAPSATINRTPFQARLRGQMGRARMRMRIRAKHRFAWPI